MRNFHDKILSGLSILLLTLLSGCANMGQGPTGGAKDVTKPQFYKSTPAENALKVSDQKIEIEFNEYIQVNNTTQNFVVSPPQKPAATAKAVGRKLVIELKDSLRPNTTYTLDFNNCIGDYTENNLIPNYCFTFSTGETVDSLVISGKILDAEYLLPCQYTYVGIYPEEGFTDSTFTTTPFERIGKTDASGNFTIKGVKAKKYKIFALSDINGNFFYDQVGEAIAMQEQQLPVPSIAYETHRDTSFKEVKKEESEETVQVIDTIIEKKEKKFLPNDITLRMFQRNTKLQEFNKASRPDRNCFSLIFTKCEKSIPKITPVNFQSKDWYTLESNNLTDTLKYWITDTTITKMDTIKVAIEHIVTDQDENFKTKTDTISLPLSFKFLSDEEKKIKNAKKKEERMIKYGLKPKRTNILSLTSNTNVIGIDDTMKVVWQTPVKSLNEKMIHLCYMEDSIPHDVPFSLLKGKNLRTFLINANIEPEKDYVFTIDSFAVHDFYGNHNDTLKLKFSKKPESEYGAIRFNVKNVSGNVYVLLLNTKDETVRTQKLDNGTVFFNHLTPQNYYAKLFIDNNGNGIWDSGDYETQRLPEEVRYFPKQLQLKKGWEMEEEWDYATTQYDRPSGLNHNQKKQGNQ